MKVKLVGITLNIECPEVDLISDKIDKMLKKENNIMAKLDEVLTQLSMATTKLADHAAKMDTLNTALDGIRGDIQVLKDQIVALQAETALTDAVKAKAAEMEAGIDALGVKIDDTISENIVVPPVDPPPDEV